ncbi:neutral zinc metallopeptidase [Haloechinothrix halophila]|uniref:neutral zinc metallopeptidase n=1 Tax=Haloechinothrix halophila TaxID=1069073 RepID=UPI0003F898D5|nr:neutral zinc metallopeptidase [Haloechinothrix halophila]
MTPSPHEQRPDSPAHPEPACAAKSPRTHLIAIVVTCAAVITLLATGVAVLIAALSTDDDTDTTAQEQSTQAQPNGQGSAAGARPPSETTPNVMPGKVLELASHPLLQSSDVGLPNRACQLPPWGTTEKAARAFFRSATTCLNDAWAPLLRSHNLPFTPPRLYFPAGETFDSDCGRIEVGLSTAAYYCEGELFLPFNGLQIDQYEDSPGVYLALIAHEYGHHVQELAGIMDAAWRKIYRVGEDSPAGQEMSRRKELQAQCFSGMFLGSHVNRGGSITREMYDQAWHDQETRGDDTSGGHKHGSNENYAMWWRVGALDNRISDCNTFKASTGSVR